MDLETLLHPDVDAPVQQELSNATSQSHTDAYPPESTVAAFWRRVAYLTTRTRCSDGSWVGTYEVRQWNRNNTESCSKCSKGRSRKKCDFAADQVSCRPCRLAKTSCDRKTKFLFAATRRDFFPTMEEFLQVYNSQPPAKSRSFQKTANKGLKKTLPVDLDNEHDIDVYIQRGDNIVSEGFNGTRCKFCRETRSAIDASSSHTESVVGRAVDSIKLALTEVTAKQSKMERSRQRAEANLEARHVQLEINIKRMVYDAINETVVKDQVQHIVQDAIDGAMAYWWERRRNDSASINGQRHDRERNALHYR
ncbi:hypothetical protein R3P38DRAFT_3240422 [Favolaschia claudopus]|uniref:Zn(2)-C6 fungal-type domain-containing protein n=1 Tax=Favolaschia claudopus TaxID=2862362 RepID=A0AAV9Z748_9AGAR